MKAPVRFAIAVGIITLVGPAQLIASSTLTTLASFNGVNGAAPAGLVQATNGLLYGTTFFGGAGNGGTIFRVNSDNSILVLKSFTLEEGANGGPVIQAADGKLYGTTADGGAELAGTLWGMDLGGAFTSLASFAGTNGVQPRGLAMTPTGEIVGVTTYGGAEHPGGGALEGYGTIFSFDPAIGLTNLAFFHGTNGAFPVGIRVKSNGRLIGITSFGGEGFNVAAQTGLGTLFSWEPNAGLQVALEFDGVNGAHPFWPEGLAGDGIKTVFGALTYGGWDFDATPFSGNGAVFRYNWQTAEASYEFFGGTNGARPTALLCGSDGNYYGLTEAGGAGNVGTVFRLTAGGLETLASFHGTNGAFPGATLIQGADNNFYGLTMAGGEFDQGTIFQLRVPLRPTLQIHTTHPNAVLLQWDAVVGLDYQLEASTNLLTWQTYSVPIPATNALMSYAVIPQENGPHAYRLLVIP